MQYSNARYTLNLCDSFGNKISELNTADTNQFIEVKVVRTVSSVGAIKIVFSGGNQEPAFLPLLERFGLLRKDSIIELWRTTGSISSLFLNTIWFVRLIDKSVSEQGVVKIEITAFDTLYLLAGRLVLDTTARQQNQLVYNTYISNLMCQLVYDNTQVVSVWGNNRPIANLEVGFVSYAPADIRLQIDLSKANLLSALQQLSAISISNYVPFYFDIEATSANSMLFRVYPGQRGVDRRAVVGKGDGRSSVLSVSNGTIREMRMTADWSDEITAVLPWGNNGSAALGFIVDPEYQISAFATPQSWREAVSEGANNNVGDTVQAAYGMLQNSRGTWNISATIQDTGDFRYGRDWDYGDRINVNAFGAVLDTRINSIEVTLSSKSEDIRIALAVTEEMI